MKSTAAKFTDGSSNGYLKGFIDALDGWSIRIKCPFAKNITNSNSGKFYSRKGFNTFNVRIIADKNKKILWKSVLCCGAEHDSAAFQSTSLYESLVKKMEYLYNEHLYLIGDSAYSLHSFLMVPFDSVKPHTKEDTFNYHLSSSQIYVECTFGSMYSTWGILWRPRQFSIQDNVMVVDSIC